MLEKLGSANRLSLGCCNKLPKIKWLKQQIFTSHSSGGWEVGDQGTSRFGYGEGLPVSTYLLCPYLVESRKRESSSIFLLNEHKPHHGGSTLITSSKPNFLAKVTPPKAIPFGYQHVRFGSEAENTNIHTSAPLFADKTIFSGNPRCKIILGLLRKFNE